MADHQTRLYQLLREHAVLKGDFVLSSGQRSDTYIDVRRAILRGDGIFSAGNALFTLIYADHPELRHVGGLALGSVPLTTAISFEAGLKGIDDFVNVIVRKEPKGHGTSSQIEPALPVVPGTPLAVVDDVITTAGSTLKAVKVLREAGFEISRAYAIIDREAGGREALQKEGIELTALYRLSELTAP